MEAKNYELLSDSKNNKYHQTYVVDDEKGEWKKIDFDSSRLSENKITKPELLKYEQEFKKMKQYQEKLIALGYNLKVTGTADDETIKSYHKHVSLTEISPKKKVK
ncbi:hypothetical protein ULMS_23350 [Patiriisocius marinistellae]|uniref:Uncharacterized protein n=2 Tax=Patiriisocius marinistellae TaxID=2494560 RepID=A0A5J4FVV1_9FLAO|nr:hypothetical protein ULMS_23350 [Patiriisocius marinistellae]